MPLLKTDITRSKDCGQLYFNNNLSAFQTPTKTERPNCYDHIRSKTSSTPVVEEIKIDDPNPQDDLNSNEKIPQITLSSPKEPPDLSLVISEPVATSNSFSDLETEDEQPQVE
ncbi:hypothetical protein TNCT_197291 [Trichonephila clavata]|uniref:Uncharacterized protein n=1 Tax=Trichonephila clavata TaxID=2740835 RepID=A0A8X6G0M1_TRICU|nr:hypothetical protein TNCT_197291 [Trichonephila clavata]